MRYLFGYLALLTSALLCAQGTAPQANTPKRSAANAIDETGAYRTPAATIHGTLKRITSKAVILITEGDQPVEIVRTHKTKFLRNGVAIKPADITPGTPLSVDTSLFPDLSPEAVNVMVDTSPAAKNPSVHSSAHSEMDQEEPVTAEPATTQPPAKQPESPNR